MQKLPVSLLESCLFYVFSILHFCFYCCLSFLCCHQALKNKLLCCVSENECVSTSITSKTGRHSTGRRRRLGGICLKFPPGSATAFKNFSVTLVFAWNWFCAFRSLIAQLHSCAVFIDYLLSGSVVYFVDLLFHENFLSHQKFTDQACEAVLNTRLKIYRY